MKNSPKKSRLSLKIFLTFLVVGAIVFALKPIRIRLFGFPQKDIVVFDETVPFFNQNHTIFNEFIPFYEENPIKERWNPDKEDIKQVQDIIPTCINMNVFNLYGLQNSNYKHQYFGFIENGEKILFINAFKEQFARTHSKDWTKEAIRFNNEPIFKDYFQVRISLENGECEPYHPSFPAPYPQGSTNSEYFLIGEREVIVFDQAVDFYKNAQQQRWVPAKEEIHKIQPLLDQCVKEKKPVTHDRLDDFNFQYFGYFEKGQKMLLVNAFEKQLGQGWEKRPVRFGIGSGPSGTFQIKLYPEKNQCIGLYHSNLPVPEPDNPIINNIFEFNPEHTTILDENIPFYKEDPVEERWTPTKEDIQEAEELILQCTQEKSPGLYTILDGYQFEYIGFIEEGENIILVEATRRDGTYFNPRLHIRINSKKGECLGLYLNPFKAPHPYSPVARSDFSFATEDTIIFDQSTPFYSDDRKEIDWDPNKKEMSLIEDILIECTEKYTLGLRGSLDRYKVQYFPRIEEGKQVVLVNALFHHMVDSFDTWDWEKERITPVVRGGTGYEWFQARIDFESGQCNGVYNDSHRLSGKNGY